MSGLTEKDIAIMINHLLSKDDYDEAMKHFMNLSASPDVMDRSVDLPLEMEPRMDAIFQKTFEMVNNLFGLKPEYRMKDKKLFYIQEYNFIHGILLGATIYGAAIFFPGIGRGACSLIRLGDSQTHFLRLTALSIPEAEA